MPRCKFGKFKVGTEKITRVSCAFGTTKKRQGNTTDSTKTTPYEIRDLELKSEEILRNKIKSDNWKRRQELKLKDDTEVLDMSKLLGKKAPKEPKRKQRQLTFKEKQSIGPTRNPLEKQTYL